MKAFSARAAAGRRDRIQMFCDRFLDRVVERGEMDVMADFATPLPGWTIADTLGIPQDRQQDFTRWARAQVLIYDRLGTMVTGSRSCGGTSQHARDEGVPGRDHRATAARATEDLLTELVQAEEDGDRLSTNEMVVMVVAIADRRQQFDRPSDRELGANARSASPNLSLDCLPIRN